MRISRYIIKENGDTWSKHFAFFPTETIDGLVWLSVYWHCVENWGWGNSGYNSKLFKEGN